jgi:hypothetical protein
LYLELKYPTQVRIQQQQGDEKGAEATVGEKCRHCSRVLVGRADQDLTAERKARRRQDPKHAERVQSEISRLKEFAREKERQEERARRALTRTDRQIPDHWGTYILKSEFLHYSPMTLHPQPPSNPTPLM